MENIQNTLEAWGEKIVSALKTAIPPEKDPDQFLGNSISFSINYAGFPIVFQLQLADYYNFIDRGRKPGKFPPPDIIASWIQNKQLNVIQKSTLKKIKNRNGMSTVLSQQNQLKSLAYLIGRKIARDGIPATNFYSNTINPDLFKELNNSLSAAFKQDVKSIMNYEL